MVIMCLLPVWDSVSSKAWVGICSIINLRHLKHFTYLFIINLSCCATPYLAILCILTVVILFGHFYLLIRESFPIQKGSLFSLFCVFGGFFFWKIFPKCKRKGGFPKSQVKSLCVMMLTFVFIQYITKGLIFLGQSPGEVLSFWRFTSKLF